MSSVALLIVPRVQFLDANGKPLAGGKMFFYQAGTTTPQDTFVDSLGVIKNANPVILDAGGFATVFLAAQTYKILVQDKNGVQQWVVDNVQSFNGTITATTTVTGTLISSSANPATAGFIRMANGDVIRVRNVANSLDLKVLSFDSSDRLILGDTTGAEFPAFEDTAGINPAPALSAAGLRRRYYDSSLKGEYFSEDNGPFIYRADPMINQQGPLAEVNGTGAEVTLYSFAMKAGLMQPGRGIRLKITFVKSTGAAVITYKVYLNGAGAAFHSPSDQATDNGVSYLDYEIFNNAGVQNAQNITCRFGIFPTTGAGAALFTDSQDTTTALTIKFTFNVAAGTKVTPKSFLVEYA